MAYRLLLVVSFSSLALFACTGGRRGGGTSTGRDAGTGTAPGTDAAGGGGPGNDAGSTPPGVDAGPGVGRTCPGSMVLPPSTFCPSSVAECLGECATEACALGCIQGNMICAACVSQAAIACANEDGCQALWDAFNCCMADNCRGAPDLAACQAESCQSEYEAFDACMPEACAENAIGACFP